ncbi:unnamed protein product [Heterobilharzia americana]|nr:unnamed protein product [Heterobilharzia americana]
MNNGSMHGSIYPYSNSHSNYTFPVSGNLQSYSSHLNLLHPGSNSNDNNNINANRNFSMNLPNMNGATTLRNRFLMHDLTGSSQFDHRFLSTMTNGQRVLTEQALELCSSLAAANAISLNGNTNTNQIINEKINHYHSNSEIKITHGVNESIDINNIVYNRGIHSNNNDEDGDEDNDGDGDENINPLANNANNSNNNENNDSNQYQHQQQLDLMNKTNLSLDECNQLCLQASNQLTKHNYFVTNEFLDQIKQVNEQKLLKNEKVEDDRNMRDNNLEGTEDMDNFDDSDDDEFIEEVVGIHGEDDEGGDFEDGDDDGANEVDRQADESVRHRLNSDSDE